ncbi:MAG: hypothetical protein IJT70_07145 [Clostridia bacterium]|nr:hypothetical protein [Clostridia bacterium]
MIANFVGDMLFTEGGAGIEGMTRGLNVKEKGAVRQFIDRFIAYIKSKLGGKSAEVARLEELFNKALSTSEGKGEASDRNIATLQSSYPLKTEGISPATREESKELELDDPRNVLRIQNEVNEVLDGTMPANKLVMYGKPSEILAKYLRSRNILYMPQTAIKKAVLPGTETGGKHGFGRVVVDELAYHLADPMAITGNTSEHTEKGDNSIVVWTD